MKTYRLKPEWNKTEAVQWWPPNDPRHDPEAYKFVGKAFFIAQENLYHKFDDDFQAKPGDWIIRDAAGYMDRVSPAEFAECYEPVPEGDAT